MSDRGLGRETEETRKADGSITGWGGGVLISPVYDMESEKRRENNTSFSLVTNNPKQQFRWEKATRRDVYLTNFVG